MKALSVFLLCFLIGALYCASLTFQPSFYQNVATVVFILSLCGLFTYNLFAIFSEKKFTIIHLILQLVFLNLGIGMAAFLFHSPEGFFWVQDSVLTHVPESLKYLNYIKGEHVAFKIDKVPGISTHLLSALSMSIFGVNTFATILAQLVFKVLALYFIYRFACLLWSKKEALIAAQIYGLCPTVFFYNLAFYKESAVHAYVAICLFLTMNIFLKKKLWQTIPLLVVLFLLFKERSYISFLMILIIPFFIFDWSYNLRKTHAKYFTGCIVLFTSLLICLSYVLFKKWGAIFTEVYALRDHYKSFSDVQNKYNYDIPYFVAFIKILFSPYFTFNKFKIFNDFSTLLIWGSILNQIIIATAVLGLWKSAKQKIMHLNLWLPFLSFLIAAAYISPWSGRLRDSFYPLIASYAAFYLIQNKYINKIFNKQKNA